MVTATSNTTTDHQIPIIQNDISQSSKNELATWSTNTTSSFNGQVLQFQGSLGYDGLDLFRDGHVALERGSIYGLVAPNGSGKTSLVRALATLPGFPSAGQFSLEYLSADIDTNTSDVDDAGLSARAYCLARVEARVFRMEQEIDRLESALEAASSDDVLEELTNKLGELYQVKDDLSSEASARADQMLQELQFGDYPNVPYARLSSGWKYKCQLISALLTRLDCLIVDEPSFLDTQATAWFVSQLQELCKSYNAILVLISHKEALMEQVCDRILYLNPASKTLTVYNCSFREFQAAHADRVAHAKKSKDHAEKDHAQAKSSLQNLRKQLHKREGNFEATTSKNADKRFIKGKNKEAKQKADHSAASKVRRVKKKAVEMAEQEEELREMKIPPLELKGADKSGNDRPIIELNDVEFQYEGSRDIVLQMINAQIAGTDKVLVQGANGQGKSTLAKIILCQLEPTKGDIRRHCAVTAHFHQDALFELIHKFGSHTAVAFLQTKDVHISVMEARTYLGRFGLKGNLALRPIQTLSAGQRVRLWLAREFWQDNTTSPKPCLLVLDEVTENLDKETTNSLLESLNHFSAAILAISHDDNFCQGFPATQVWNIRDGFLQNEYK
jgi:ATPase subunit of ABC transporter with duplicated ATPase domains